LVQDTSELSTDSIYFIHFIYPPGKISVKSTADWELALIPILQVDLACNSLNLMYGTYYNSRIVYLKIKKARISPGLKIYEMNWLPLYLEPGKMLT
jgi:hypothetical protein